jgi:hypothetical protein
MTREASEETKSSLKDILAKVAVAPTPALEPVRIPEVPKIEIPKEEIKISEPPLVVPIPVAPAPKSDQWQKQAPKKEVPEDVLKKVLEDN